MTDKAIVALVSIAMSTTAAHAEKLVVWRGSMDLTPCSKTEWNNNGIFGTPSPTVRTARQIASATLYLDVATGSHDILMNLKPVAERCAIEAVAAAGITAYVTGGAGSWEAASTTFQACMSSEPLYRYVVQYGADYDTSCDW